MYFNSLHFLFFFVLVTGLYYALPHRWRWGLLLAASYYFYGCWNVKYLLLIIASTLVDYFAALRMEKAERQSTRRLLLSLSLLCNLGLLFSFKYFNFFSASLQALVDKSGLAWQMPHLNVLLPVGISFYTFQTLSYSIDVYRGERKAEHHLGIFAVYVAFFPQLVAGPIERATRFLPQFRETHVLEYGNVVSGLRLMLLGLFKKIVVADRLAIYVDNVYNNVHFHDSSTSFLLATYFFAFQIYCDFSGYSDIAIGAGRVMGFDLMTNFRTPYLSKSTAEFWRRWHISLSTWFRDYVYIPLGGSRVDLSRHCANIFIVFVVSGLWHGANWTFVIWGALHGLYQLLAILRKHLFPPGPPRLPQFLLDGLRIFVTFHLVCFGWIFFRANNLADALHVVRAIFSGRFSFPYLGNTSHFAYGLFALGCLLLLEIWFRQGDPSEKIAGLRTPLRWALYLGAAMIILLIGVFDGGQFIYFQF